MSEARRRLKAELNRIQVERTRGITNADVITRGFTLALGAAVVALENAERLDRIEAKGAGDDR